MSDVTKDQIIAMLECDADNGPDGWWCEPGCGPHDMIWFMGGVHTDVIVSVSRSQERGSPYRWEWEVLYSPDGSVADDVEVAKGTTRFISFALFKAKSAYAVAWPKFVAEHPDLFTEPQGGTDQ